MPQTLEQPPVLELDNPLAARILADPDIAVYLKPFMREPLALKAAARECGLPIQAMHYRAQQMLQAGLLEVVGLEARRGRPVKYYQARARAFRFALDLVPQSVLEGLANHLSWKQNFEQGLAQARSGQGEYEEHLTVYLDPDGLLIWGSSADKQAEQTQFLSDDYPAVLNLWSGGLRLDKAEAKAMQRELWELYERYAHRRGTGKYILHLGLVSAPEKIPVQKPKP